MRKDQRKMFKIGLLNYLKKSFFTGSIKNIIVILTTILLFPLIIREVGIENYGLISLVMIFGGVVTIADFGISKTVTVLIGQQQNDASTVVFSALCFQMIILAFIGLAILAISFYETPLFGERINLPPDLTKYMLLVGYLFLTISLINNLMNGILESFFLIQYVQLGQALSSIMLSVFTYILGVLSDSIYVLLVSPLLSVISVFVVLLTIIKSKTTIKIRTPNVKYIWLILSMSYKFMSIGAVNSSVTPFSKYLIIYTSGSATILAVFDISLKIAMMSSGFLSSVSQPLLGVFSNKEYKNEKVYSISVKVSSIVFLGYIFGVFIYYTIGMSITNYVDPANSKVIFDISLILLIGCGFIAVSEPCYKAFLGAVRLKEALYLKFTVLILYFSFYLILADVTHRVEASYSLAYFFNALIVIIYFMFRFRRMSE
jgi:O-antigen/teichoic acid export membrane protein